MSHDLSEEELDSVAKDYKETVAHNVQLLMDQNQWVQADLAKKSGVAQKTISNIVRTGSTSTGKLAAIAKAFGIEPWTLLQRDIGSVDTAQRVEALVRAYLECGETGRSQIDRTAEAELRYINMQK